MFDSEMFDERMRDIYIRLIAVGKKNSDYPVFSQSFCTQCCNYRTVFSSWDGYNSIASGTVFIKPVSYPRDNIIFYFLCIKVVIQTRIYTYI